MIVTTDIDVLVFPNWLYGQIQRYTRKQALLDPIRDPDNDRIVGQNFLTDPDFNELRSTSFNFASQTKLLAEWLTIKKYKYEEIPLT